MPTTTIFLLALAAIVALGLVYFKYFVGNKNRGTTTSLLAGLRFITIFLLLLLLINPGINKRELEVEKPKLIVAVDNSASIEYLERADSVRTFTEALVTNQELELRFDIDIFTFGNEIIKSNLELLAFEKPQTDINSAITNIEKISGKNQTAVVLITDGNQTLGTDYFYYQPKDKINVFPIIAGDTTTQQDLYISNLNVNKYAFLNNDFPIEVIINYSGTEAIESQFTIRSSSRILYSNTFNFTPENPSQVVTTTIPATHLGTGIYEAVIAPLSNEKNITNNQRKFGVEVIDERTSVIIISSVAHPDLGVFKKAIESNEQREAKIEYLENFDISDLTDFQLVILYQPNNQFKQVFQSIEDNNLNFLITTGTVTNWNFINLVQQDFTKDLSNQEQDIFANFNPNFSAFQFDNIGFEDFPPLEDKFGTINFTNPSYNTMLFQQLEGISMEFPLLATLENNSTRKAVLFGENIWRWRAQSFLNSGTFQDFDNFIGKLIQYLASKQKRDRLTVDTEAVYLENENILITAQFFDQNYVFDPNGQLEIILENPETENGVESPMLPSNNRYTFEAEGLAPGEYNFVIKELTSGITRTGNIAILEYNIEQQFTSANITGMKELASNTSQQLFFLNNQEELIQRLLTADTYIPVQKIREKTVPLIDWKFLLGLLILSLAAEWFTRKYFGLI